MPNFIVFLINEFIIKRIIQGSQLIHLQTQIFVDKEQKALK